MKKTFKLFSLVVCLFLNLSSQTAQAQISQNKTTMGLRGGVAVVMFSGLAGAVLGASTLSFYGEPQEHVNNIWTGLAVGALLGGGYVLSQGRDSVAGDPWPTNPHQVATSRPYLWQIQTDF